MIPLDQVSPERIAGAWQGGEKYRIDARLVRQNLLDHPLLHREASTWQDGTFVAIKRSAVGLYQGPDPKVAHLSLFGEIPDGPLDHAIETLRDDGVEALVVGMDSAHFLPGAPIDIPGLERWLGSRGFVPGGLAHDLEHDLQTDSSPTQHRSEIFRPVQEKDRGNLTTFLEREFPGRWTYDVLGKIAIEGPATVFGMFVDDRCEGFSLLQSEGARRPIGGAVWHADLGEQWGSLGPIGISKEVRGQGLGEALLIHSLAHLRARNVHRTIIDWTTLTEFYGKRGFKVTRSYRAYRLSISSRD